MARGNQRRPIPPTTSRARSEPSPPGTITSPSRTAARISERGVGIGDDCVHAPWARTDHDSDRIVISAGSAARRLAHRLRVVVERVQAWDELREGKRRLARPLALAVHGRLDPVAPVLSAAALGLPETVMDLVRVGTACYGFWPRPDIYDLHLEEAGKASAGTLAPGTLRRDADAPPHRRLASRQAAARLPPAGRPTGGARPPGRGRRCGTAGPDRDRRRPVRRARPAGRGAAALGVGGRAARRPARRAGRPDSGQPRPRRADRDERPDGAARRPVRPERPGHLPRAGPDRRRRRGRRAVPQAAARAGVASGRGRSGRDTGRRAARRARRPRLRRRDGGPAGRGALALGWRGAQRAGGARIRRGRRRGARGRGGHPGRGRRRRAGYDAGRLRLRGARPPAPAARRRRRRGALRREPLPVRLRRAQRQERDAGGASRRRRPAHVGA